MRKCNVGKLPRHSPWVIAALPRNELRLRGEVARVSLRRVFVILVFATLSLPMLSGCQMPSDGHSVRIGRPAVVLPELSDTCELGPVLPFVGQDFAELAAFDLQDLRIIAPGQKVTEEISPSRLNAEVDADGRIRRLFCG